MMKNTPEDNAVTDKVHRAAREELTAFVERFERLDEEKKAIADQQKEVLAEAKGRGYCTKSLRKIIAMRKKDRDALAEEEAVLDMYREVLGL